MYQLTRPTNESYIPSDDLLSAINTALLLNKPLLLTGEPGTGKTECADFIARQLKRQFPESFHREEALRFNTKSVSVYNDLNYNYDAVEHFNHKGELPKESFISLRSMGMALMGSHPENPDWYTFKNYKKDVVSRGCGYGSVVLIDEIDKAPRDFPNDILAELEKPPFKFRIKELDELEIVQNPEKPVVVIISSNNEKGLPDAFLRRCVFHYIDFPSNEKLLDIVKSNLAADNPFYSDAINLFVEIRNLRELNKKPATSELIDWIACLVSKELMTSDLKDLKNASPEYLRKLEETLGVIAKSKYDSNSIKRKIGTVN